MSNPVRRRRFESLRRRGSLLVLPVACAAAALLAVLQGVDVPLVSAFLALPEAASETSASAPRRHWATAAAAAVSAGVLPEVVRADIQDQFALPPDPNQEPATQAEGVTQFTAADGTVIKQGDEYTITYDSPNMRDEITFGGGASTTSYVVVTSVKQDSPAYALGVRVGDVLSSMVKGGAYKFNLAIYDTQRQSMPEFFSGRELEKVTDPEKVVKKFVNREPVPTTLVFVSKGMIQVGQPMAQFAALGTANKLIKSDLLMKGGKTLVLFFRPGSLIDGGKDERQVELWNKVTDVLDELNAQLVGVSIEFNAYTNNRITQVYNLTYPLIADTGNQGAKLSEAFGALRPKEATFKLLTRRVTYIIGPDGIVRNLFPDVGFKPKDDDLINHMLEVLEALGASQEKLEQISKRLSPKQMTLGDVFALTSPSVAQPDFKLPSFR